MDVRYRRMLIRKTRFIGEEGLLERGFLEKTFQRCELMRAALIRAEEGLLAQQSPLLHVFVL